MNESNCVGLYGCTKGPTIRTNWATKKYGLINKVTAVQLFQNWYWYGREPIALDDNNNIGGNNKSNMKSEITQKMLVIKRIIEDLWLKYHSGDQITITRVYHLWPANNVHILNLICSFDLLTNTTPIK